MYKNEKAFVIRIPMSFDLVNMTCSNNQGNI